MICLTGAWLRARRSRIVFRGEVSRPMQPRDNLGEAESEFFRGTQSCPTPGSRPGSRQTLRQRESVAKRARPHVVLSSEHFSGLRTSGVFRGRILVSPVQLLRVLCHARSPSRESHIPDNKTTALSSAAVLLGSGDKRSPRERLQSPGESLAEECPRRPFHNKKEELPSPRRTSAPSFKCTAST